MNQSILKVCMLFFALANQYCVQSGTNVCLVLKARLQFRFTQSCLKFLEGNPNSIFLKHLLTDLTILSNIPPYQVEEQMLIYCDVFKLSLYLYYCNWRQLKSLHKERKLLQNTFVGNILSKMLKWILGSLKSLICSEDTKNSQPRFSKGENTKRYTVQR